MTNWKREVFYSQGFHFGNWYEIDFTFYSVPLFSLVAVKLNNSSFTSTLTHETDVGSTQIEEPLSMLSSTESCSHSTQNWIKNFKTPKQYSVRTMAALARKQKSSITSAVCSEIITSISTLVKVHTMYPTPEEYTAISCQLVKQHHILEDSFGCGFTTWRN